MKRIMTVALTGCLLVGCDFELPSQRRAKEEAIRQEAVRQEKKETEMAQAKGECLALKHHVGVQLGLVQASRAEAEKLLAELVEDRKVLSARLTELSEKSMSDKSGTRATALYAVLKDDGVNAIALKYLGNDFAVLRSEFAEKMRFVLKKENARKAALSKNRADFDRAVKEGEARAEESRRAISTGLAQIKRDIAETESRLQHLRRDSLSSSTQSKKNRERAILEAEHRLSILRSRYTEMLSNNAGSRLARESDADASSTRAKALLERDKADKAVQAQSKGDVTSFQLAEEYEERTIRRLDAAILEKDTLVHAQLKLAGEKMTYLQCVTNGIDQLDSTGLQRVRADISAMLAKEPQNDKAKDRR